MILFVVLLRTIAESLAQCNVPLYKAGKTMEVLMVQLNEYQLWYYLDAVLSYSIQCINTTHVNIVPSFLLSHPNVC
jgi:hypothetical protein